MYDCKYNIEPKHRRIGFHVEINHHFLKINVIYMLKALSPINGSDKNFDFFLVGGGGTQA